MRKELLTFQFSRKKGKHADAKNERNVLLLISDTVAKWGASDLCSSKFRGWNSTVISGNFVSQYSTLSFSIKYRTLYGVHEKQFLKKHEQIKDTNDFNLVLAVPVFYSGHGGYLTEHSTKMTIERNSALTWALATSRWTDLSVIPRAAKMIQVAKNFEIFENKTAE